MPEATKRRACPATDPALDDPTSPHMRVGALAARMGVSIWWVRYRYAHDPSFPQPIRGDKVLFSRADVATYLEAWPGSRNRRREQAEGPGPWLTVSAAAELMSVGTHEVHALADRDATFPRRKYLANKPVFDAPSLETWLAQRAARVAARRAAKVAERAIARKENHPAKLARRRAAYAAKRAQVAQAAPAAVCPAPPPRGAAPAPAKPPAPEPVPPPPAKSPQCSNATRAAKLVLLTLSEYFRDHDIDPDPERAAIDFARAHAACTLVIPDMQTIERLASERAIADAVERDPTAGTRTRLAELHGIDRRNVAKVARKAAVAITEQRQASTG